ncbi:MAB_1171c family putative transporter [Amycolatopsis nalaikhensis]|uniref:DUF6545 domain-containing protein n=1 Tax=Amycolatopsis nalaikhensis TaxID=715472 RepID=A0ABY8XU94_9PSEU|nr:MAB_1171c family putative transporter [Amycolatopsis sp. 2-2]WIV59226.1 hypothetical protein QP939_11645 [Amycolatopsis sp. 2-2]
MTQLSPPFVVIAVVLLIGLTQRIYAMLSDRRDPLRRAVCVILAGLLLATVAQLFSDPVDRATGVVHFGATLSDAGAMIAACAGRLFLVHVDRARPEVGNRGLRCYASLAAALAAAAALFLLFPPQPGQRAPVYVAVYIAYIANVLIPAWRLGVRYSRRTGRPFLRVGLRVIAAGGAAGLAFLLCQTVLLVTGLLDPAVTASIDAVTSGLELVTETLLLIGVTIPLWGPMLVDAVHWPADYRSYRRLRPLWLALQEAGPEFRLLPADAAAARSRWPRDIGLLLYRQVIEIRDGQLALRPYVERRVTDEALQAARRAGLPPAEAGAAVEAAAIVSGIAAKADGRVATEPAGPGRGAHEDGLAAETAWLRSVARAFARSPIVAAAARNAAAPV